MTPVHPPLDSPVPPEPAPGDSGVRPLTKRELREIKEAEAKVAKSKRRLNFIYGSVGMVVATVAITMTVNAWAGGKVDAGVAPVAKDLAEHKAEEKQAIAEVKEEVKAVAATLEKERERNDKRWEAVLWRLNVRDPAPPSPPADAGTCTAGVCR